MARRSFTPIVMVLAVIVFLGLLPTPFRSHLSSIFGGAQQGSSYVTHVVLFQWKTSADPQDIDAANKRMLALRRGCNHPRHGVPYIKSLKGGRDNSIEDRQGGATHGFVLEFESIEDRDYYVRSDPAHKLFRKSIEGIVEKATVLDFTDHIF